MFIGIYTDGNENRHCDLYGEYNLKKDIKLWHERTWSPGCRMEDIIDFVVEGDTYAERKACVQNVAIIYSNTNTSGLSYGELYGIEHWFRTQGKRYGLMKEFKENGIC